MTDYSQMSDQKLNMTVAKIMHPTAQVIESKSRPPCATVLGHQNHFIDYCNNPADAWPIIQANKISLVAPTKLDVKEEWIAYLSWESDECVPHVNPLRAGMIAFLMMKGAIDAPAI
jgi:hypothetical protein